MNESKMTQTRKAYTRSYRAHRTIESALRAGDTGRAEAAITILRHYRIQQSRAEAAAYESWDMMDRFRYG